MHLLAVILLSVGALCLWIPSFMYTESVGKVVFCMALSIVNTLLWMYVCYHGNLIRIFDLFAGFIFLLTTSCLSRWHEDWQSQCLLLILNLLIVVIQSIDRHQFRSAAEHMFQITLLLGVASYFLPSIILLIIPVIGYLMYRNIFDSQSLLAILLGILIVALYAAIGCYLGWLEPTWLSFFRGPYLLRWIPITGAALSAIITLICYTGDGVWRGSTFLGYMTLCLTLWLIQIL